jgi:hypothetical protein
MIPVAYLFTTSTEIRKRLYDELEKEHQMLLLFQWGIMNKSNIVSSIIGFFVNLILILFAFYYTFGFCLVWSQWSTTLNWFFVFSILADSIALEVLIELLVAMVFALKNYACTRALYLKLESYRNLKSLI